MSDFAQITFTRIKEQYEDIDVGSGALYAVIAEHLSQGFVELPLRIAEAAMNINSQSDPFIVDDVTTNTEVFLEVFRRAMFQPLGAAPNDEDRETSRKLAVGAATYLSNFRMHLLQQM